MALTAKQEAFTLAVFEGRSQADAYRLAYDAENMSDNAVYVAASKLMDNAKVSQRLAALRQRAEERSQVTVERVVREYARIAFADMRHFAAVGPYGVTLRDSEEWTDDDAAAVAEVAESTSKDGGSIRFKLHNKVSALDALAKYLGMFEDSEKREGDKHLHLHGLTDDQLRALSGHAAER